MMVAGALLIAATIFVIVAPRMLLRFGDRAGEPFVALLWWLGSMATGVVTFTVGAGMLLLPGDSPAGMKHHFADGCWAFVGHDHIPAVDELIGAVSLAAMGVGLARFVRALVRGLRAQRDVHRAHIGLLRVTTGGSGGSRPVLWIEDVQPFAYSIRGRPGLVIASSAVRAMPPLQASAVLCHERAHLHGGHHLLVLISQALRTAVPFVPLFRAAPAAVGMLVELDADTSAVRSCGSSAVHAALLVVSSGTAAGAGTALSVAGGELPQRLTRIAQPHPDAGFARRVLSRGAAVIGSAVLPSAVGVATLTTALALSCPATG